jgi:hypothetical protein
MNDDRVNVAALLDEQLVAYLDGELGPDDSRRIEELLASETTLRRRLQEMERTWELLDDLDTAPAAERFAQSTLEMVAIAAQKDVEEDAAVAPRRRRRLLLAIGGSLLAAALAGFLAAWLLLDPNRPLLRDLPVIENLELYRPVGDIEFLRLLRGAGLFLTNDSNTSGVAPQAPSGSPAERRERIEGMSLVEKEHLLRLQEQFDDLDREQRDRLRQLDESLRAAADGPELWPIMRRYCGWLKTRFSFTRAELEEQPAGDRLKSVQKLLRQDQAGEGRRLVGKDAEALLQWMRDFVARHKAELLDELPQSERKKFDSLPPARQRAELFGQLRQQRQAAGPGKLPPFATDADLARLRAELSPEVRKRLEGKPTAQQWQQVAVWMRHLGGPRPTRDLLSPADDQRLYEFFEKLSEEEKGRLLSMPGEDMQRELLRLYSGRTGRHGEGRQHERSPRDRASPSQQD